MASSVFTPEQEQRINELLIDYLAQNGANIDTGVNVTELTGDALTDENLKKLTIPSILPNTNQWAYTSLQNMMAPIQHAIANLQTDDAQVQITIGNAQTATTAATAAAATANTAATGANTAATGANTAATGANTAATNANTKANYAQTQGDYAKEWNDHPPYIADGTTEHRGDPYYMYLWDITTHAYVRGAYVKGADLDYSTMTPEEYARLVENVKSSVLFATVQTCEDIIDELV